MKKKILLIILIAFSLVLAGCASDYSGPSQGEVDNEIEIVPETTPNRKIIYSVSMNIDTTKMAEVVQEIQDLMGSSDWIDKMEISHSYTLITLRIKTTNLNEFVNSIKGTYKTTNYQMKAQDVSVNYYDLTNRKTALKNEQARLLVLYESANMQEIIQINERLAAIDITLQNLNKELNQYDSLIEYSTVSISINQVTSITEKGFFKQIGAGFVSGWQAFVTFVKYLLIALSYVLPWALVIGPVTAGVIITVKQVKKRKKDK